MRPVDAVVALRSADVGTRALGGWQNCVAIYPAGRERGVLGALWTRIFDTATSLVPCLSGGFRFLKGQLFWTSKNRVTNHLRDAPVGLVIADLRVNLTVGALRNGRRIRRTAGALRQIEHPLAPLLFRLRSSAIRRPAIRSAAIGAVERIQGRCGNLGRFGERCRQRWIGCRCN